MNGGALEGFSNLHLCKSVKSVVKFLPFFKYRDSGTPGGVDADILPDLNGAGRGNEMDGS
jgi:hypothetical protein